MNFSAVAFDLFGTLLFRTNRRHSYLELFRRLDVDPREGAVAAMANNLDLRQLAQFLRPGHSLDLADLEADLKVDLDGIRLFDDTLEILDALRSKEFPIALISNLARPFAERAIQLLGTDFTAIILSCEVGMLKPDPAIFYAAAQKLQLPPGKILMIGDTLRDDVAGADAVDMPVLLIDREGFAANNPRVISSLQQIVELKF